MAERSEVGGGANSRLRATALFALLLSTLLPATASVELFPSWDLDPTRNVLPSTGLQPAGLLALTVLTLIAAALAILADTRDRRPVLWGQSALAGLGAAGVLIHGLTNKAGIEHLLHAGPWLALAAAWLAAAHLCRDTRTRAVTLAVLAAFAVPLLAKGLHQILFEHPPTVADFLQRKDEILASRGWSPGSPSALAYERRLMQADAAGWFGLSNVAATFAAAIVAGLAATLLAILRARFRPTKRAPGASPGSPPSSPSIPFLLALTATSLTPLAFLILTRSKGGLGAAVAALLAVAFILLVRKLGPAWSTKITRLAGPGIALAVLAVVALRGLLGEQLGELSLLFRSQYITGALRIWADNPLLGVGPAGFQDAYAAAKPPLSPETVQSPHSVLFDWTATLGLLGLAWAAWLAWQSTRLPRHELHEDEQRDTEETKSKPDRDTIRFTTLTIAVVSIASIFIARALATPEFAVMRLAALVGWIAAALLLLPLFSHRRHADLFALAAGLALLAHIQIEVTPIWVNAAPLLGVFLGAVFANHAPIPRATQRGPGASLGSPASFLTPSLLPALALIALAIFMTAHPLRVAWRWQTALAHAAAVVRPVAQLQTDLSRLYLEPDPTAQRAAAGRLAGSVSTMLGQPVPPRPDALRSAIEFLRIMQLEPAALALDDAIQARPTHAATTRGQGRLWLDIIASHPDDDLARGGAEIARDSAGNAARYGTVSAIDWHAVVLERSADLLAARGLTSDEDVPYQHAGSLWGILLERQPHAVRPAVQLMDLAAKLGNAAAAGEFATEALRRDENTRLDPLAGLTDDQRDRAQRLASPD